jgi:WD40 repeat protein
MSYCLNPNCSNPQNPDEAKFCQTCGTKLLLAERYRAIRLIGRGGFGRTLFAEDEYKPSKPRCVIKQFYPQGQNNAQKAAELFQQEAVRLEELGQHPQIPELFAHFEQENRQYIVQEFIDGQTLAQELAEMGIFREEQIRSLLSDVLPVLQFIHAQGVIHRDIKPANLIRRRTSPQSSSYQGGARGGLVIVDFGAAKYATVSALGKTGTTIGSAGYAAPEQTFGKAVFASDLYSLGVTCLHLLTQMKPFDLYDVSESGFVWRHYLVNNPVSDELSCILDKMTQSVVKQRYQSAEEVMQALGLGEGTYSATKLPVPPASKPVNALPSPSIQIVSSKTTSANLSLITTLSGHLTGVSSIALTPDGQILASGSADRTIKIWNLSTGKVQTTLSGHSSAVNSVAFSPDGQTLASGSVDKTIKLWDIRTAQELYTLKGHSNSVLSVALTPDGQILASASWDQTIKLWNVGTLAEKHSLFRHSSLVNAVTFSPDGQTLASGSVDNTIKLWDVGTGQELCTLKGHSNSVHSVAFSPDGQTLASGGSDFNIKLWDINTLSEKRTLKGHLVRVRSIAFSPDGQTLASGSVDKKIKLWDVHTGQELCSVKVHLNSVHSVAFSRDGQTLATGSWDTTIKIWQVTR